MYNLPTWLCQKREYHLLLILIQGLKHTGIDIGVFIEPLMQEMETLWKEGIGIFDGFTRQTFNLEALSSSPSMITTLSLCSSSSKA
jgi:hypothetical protein